VVVKSDDLGRRDHFVREGLTLTILGQLKIDGGPVAHEDDRDTKLAGSLYSSFDNLMGGIIAPHGIDCNSHTLGSRLLLLLFLLDHELAIVIPTIRADVMCTDKLVAVPTMDKGAMIVPEAHLDFAVSIALPTVGYFLLWICHSTSS
jgi:hypothetical protein